MARTSYESRVVVWVAATQTMMPHPRRMEVAAVVAKAIVTRVNRTQSPLWAVLRYQARTERATQEARVTATISATPKTAPSMLVVAVVV